MYTDQTGAFPIRSKKGNRCMIVLVEVDQNRIISEPTRSRTSGKFTKSYQVLTKRLKRKAIVPKNECSQESKDAIMENNVEYKLVPKG